MKFLVLRRRQENLRKQSEIDRLEETILQTMNTEYRKGGKILENVRKYVSIMHFSGIAARTEDRELWETLVREFGLRRRINNLHPQIAFTNAFIGNYLRIEFLYEAGLYDEVITNIRKYFLPMAEKTGTLWEHDSSTGSCNHGFASYVIYWLAGIYGIFSENGPEMEVTYSLC